MTQQTPHHSTRLFEELHAALVSYGIPHGELEFLSRSNNDAFVDSTKTIFIKSTLFAEASNLNRELEFAKAFGDTIHTFTPLIPELLQVQNGGIKNSSTRYASVWKFEPNIEPVRNYQLNSQIVETLVRELMRIHELPLKDFVEPYKHEWITKVVERRLAFAENKHQKKDKNTDLLSELVDKLLPPDKFTWPAEQLVTNHGDAHLGNFARIAGTYRWFDFESVVALPREWDIAAVSLTFRRHRNLEPLWEQAVQQFSTVGEIDFALVEFFETVKLLSSSAFMLLHPFMYDAFDKRMQLMQTMLAGEKLPAKLPNLPSRLSNN